MLTQTQIKVVCGSTLFICHFIISQGTPSHTIIYIDKQYYVVQTNVQHSLPFCQSSFHIRYIEYVMFYCEFFFYVRQLSHSQKLSRSTYHIHILLFLYDFFEFTKEIY